MKLRAQTAAALFTAAHDRHGRTAYIVIDGDTIKAPYGVTYRLIYPTV